MAIDSERDKLVLRSWSLIHRVRDVLMRCEDERYGKYGLTSEQYGVLVTIKYIGESARITDIARWSARSSNSVSMIVDRMVKAGLVKRARDRRDRRVVFVSLTSKAQQSLGPATADGLEFIQKVASPLSDKDVSTLVRLLDTVRQQALTCVNQKLAPEEMGKDEITSQTDLMKRLRQFVAASASEVKHRGGAKKRTPRRK
jgi:MarR family 2-MHQ and catechol resistance regulon transcriptional repressor